MDEVHAIIAIKDCLHHCWAQYDIVRGNRVMSNTDKESAAATCGTQSVVGG